ncbi:MAG: GAF domain-containing protein [Myxococcota bacterium]|nr:GAF domain-containing protein [Myxococcota bacterium]
MQAHHLQRLHALALQLSRPRSLEQVADAVIGVANGLIGAHVSILWLVVDGTAVLIRDHAGGHAQPYARMALDADVPVAEALRTATPIWFESLAAMAARFPRSHERAKASLEALAVEGSAVLPLVVDGHTVGALVLGFPTVRTFDDAERELLTLYAAHAAVAIDRARLEAELHSAVYRLGKLHELTSALATLGSEADIAAQIVVLGREALGNRACVMWIERAGVLHLAANVGVPAEYLANWEQIALDSDVPAARVFTDRVPLWVESEAEYERVSPTIVAQARGVQRVNPFAAIPLITDGRVLGVITFSFVVGHHFSAADREYLVSLATQCAKALNNVQLHERERLARERAEASSRRLTHLQEITAALADTATFGDVFGVCEQRIAPAFGAAVARLYLLGPDRQLRRTTPMGFAALPAESAGVFDLDDPDALISYVARSATPLYLADLEEVRRLRPGVVASFETAGMQACAFAPLPRAGDVAGVLTIVFASPCKLSAPERRLFESIAQQCAHAVERVQLHATNAVARHEAEAANRAKDEFLAMLGHELRNPLAPIVTSLELVALDPTMHERAHRTIERHVRHLQRLVDDLLEISRITRGNVELRRTLVELDEIVRQVIETASPLIEKRAHRVHVELEPGLLVDADRARVIQIVANLVINAAKYTPAGGDIWLRAHADAGEAVVTVADSGVGIHPELLPRVFEAFIQGAQRRDRADGGLGLGLAIVKNLVELHGGSVVARANQRLDKGTEVVVRLPRATRVADVAAAATATIAQGAHRPLRVLLVDDNVDAADLLGDLLRTQDCEVRVAYDAAQALEIAHDFRPQLALLDVGLPLMDGYELGRRLRALPGFLDVPLVALTGYGGDHGVASSRAAGFHEHLNKPVAFDRLQQLLATVVATAR